MPLFTRRHHYSSTTTGHHPTTGRHSTRRGLFHRKDRDRVAGGYKAALSNPNTTRSGRRHAKHELRMMGRSHDTHVPLMTKIKRALGIRSTHRHPATTRTTRTTRRRRFF